MFAITIMSNNISENNLRSIHSLFQNQPKAILSKLAKDSQNKSLSTRPYYLYAGVVIT